MKVVIRMIRTFFSRFWTIGPVTIYGANAMNWAVNISTKRWGYVCFTLPTIGRIFRNRDSFDRWYFYCSPNGTPGYSTFYLGPEKEEVFLSKVRRYCLGHNFDKVVNKTKVYYLRELFPFSLPIPSNDKWYSIYNAIQNRLQAEQMQAIEEDVPGFKPGGFSVYIHKGGHAGAVDWDQIDRDQHGVDVFNRKSHNGEFVYGLDFGEGKGTPGALIDWEEGAQRKFDQKLNRNLEIACMRMEKMLFIMDKLRADLDPTFKEGKGGDSKCSC